MNYRRSDAPEHATSNEKDILIATMKKQLYQIQDLEHEYLKLIDEVKAVESKHSMLQEDNQRLESEFKIKSDINRTTITQLRNEIDGLKIQIHKCSVQIDDTMREIANLKRVCDNRENQIAAQISYNQQLEKNNNDQIDANNSLASKIRSLKEERNRAENECERLHRMLDQNMANLKNLEKEARAIQSSNQKHESIIHIAETDHNDLVDDLKSREEQVSITNQKLGHLKQEREELKDKTNKLEKQCIKSDSDLRNVAMDLQNSISKNKQLANKLKTEEKVLRKGESDLEQSHIRREALMKDHNSQATQYKILNSQIDRCMISILEYEKTNEELQRHVRHFIECDQEARSMLNRKEAMGQMLDQVMSKLNKTSEDIAHLR